MYLAELILVNYAALLARLHSFNQFWRVKFSSTMENLPNSLNFGLAKISRYTVYCNVSLVY